MQHAIMLKTQSAIGLIKLFGNKLKDSQTTNDISPAPAEHLSVCVNADLIRLVIEVLLPTVKPACKVAPLAKLAFVRPRHDLRHSG
jgi:hypothetical protein